MTNIRINVTSDTVCPWCYVGRKQLQLAQQLWHTQHPDSGDTFTVHYAPFQLNPHWPKGPASSTDKEQYYQEKFGAARTDMIHSRLREVGKLVGIEFRFGGRTGNSRDSHRLVHLAKNYGADVEGKAIDGLFAAFFENERDITDYETLRGIATRAGIPEDAFQKAIIDSDEGGADVDKAASRARLNGVSGVPDYVVQDRFRLSGARDPTAFVRAFEKVKAMEKGEEVSDED